MKKAITVHARMSRNQSLYFVGFWLEQTQQSSVSEDTKPPQSLKIIIKHNLFKIPLLGALDYKTVVVGGATCQQWFFVDLYCGTVFIWLWRRPTDRG